MAVEGLGLVRHHRLGCDFLAFFDHGDFLCHLVLNRVARGPIAACWREREDSLIGSG